MTHAFAPEMRARLEQINRGQFAHYVSPDDEAALHLYFQDQAIHHAIDAVERIIDECAEVKHRAQLRLALIRFFYNLALARNSEIATLQERIIELSGSIVPEVGNG